jgi:pimeloyl-ACP methyl ester carboxylesterase
VRVVLVHGSGGNAESAWAPLQALSDRFELVAPNRGGYPPGPLLERIDFEEQADELAPLLQDGAHLVGHSYGGLIRTADGRAATRVRPFADRERAARVRARA